METTLVTQGEGRCLLGSPAAKRLHVLKVGPELGGMANVYSVGNDIDGIAHRFPKVFSGVGELSGYQLKVYSNFKLHIDPEVKPVAQKPRRIPYPLKEKVTKKKDELLNLDIIEKVSGPTTWVSPAVFVPKPNKDDVRICVDMRPYEGKSFQSQQWISAPEQYQNIVEQIIAGCPGATDIADDIVVHGKTTEDHDRNLVALLNRLQERNLTLNKDNCKIGMNQIVFMGLLKQARCGTDRRKGSGHSRD
ncbi:hypothetical protein ACROYT_G028351 [Oculina patagonica]